MPRSATGVIALDELVEIAVERGGRGKVLAAINGVSRAGSILALGLGGLLGGLLGPRVTFVGGAVCALVVVAALAWLLRGVDPTGPIPENLLAVALGAA